jgi:hypothetical protein
LFRGVIKRQWFHTASVIGLLTSLAHSSKELAKRHWNLRARRERGSWKYLRSYLEGNVHGTPFLGFKCFGLRPDTFHSSTFHFAVPEY